MELTWVELLSKYIVFPALSAVATIGWFMFKKHDVTLDLLHEEVETLKKDIAEVKTEIKTEFKYIARDIREIKDMLIKLNDKR